jgi:hypothetical protein
MNEHDATAQFLGTRHLRGHHPYSRHRRAAELWDLSEADIVGSLVSRYFGLRHYGEIYGYIFAIFTIGSGLRPYLMGLSFDKTHSYSVALGAFCGILMVASATISRLGPYRFPAKATGKCSCGKGESLALVAPADHRPERAA